MCVFDIYINIIFSRKGGTAAGVCRILLDPRFILTSDFISHIPACWAATKTYSQLLSETQLSGRQKPRSALYLPTWTQLRTNIPPEPADLKIQRTQYDKVNSQGCLSRTRLNKCHLKRQHSPLFKKSFDLLRDTETERTCRPVSKSGRL